MIKKINIGELNINPINPRKITPDATKEATVQRYVVSEDAV